MNTVKMKLSLCATSAFALATAVGAEPSTLSIYQTGDGHTISVDQSAAEGADTAVGLGQSTDLRQSGSSHDVSVIHKGVSNDTYVGQGGVGSDVFIRMEGAKNSSFFGIAGLVELDVLVEGDGNSVFGNLSRTVTGPTNRISIDGNSNDVQSQPRINGFTVIDISGLSGLTDDGAGDENKINILGGNDVSVSVFGDRNEIFANPRGNTDTHIVISGLPEGFDNTARIVMEDGSTSNIIIVGSGNTTDAEFLGDLSDFSGTTIGNDNSILAGAGEGIVDVSIEGNRNAFDMNGDAEFNLSQFNIIDDGNALEFSHAGSAALSGVLIEGEDNSADLEVRDGSLSGSVAGDANELSSSMSDSDGEFEVVGDKNSVYFGHSYGRGTFFGSAQIVGSSNEISASGFSANFMKIAVTGSDNSVTGFAFSDSSFTIAISGAGEGGGVEPASGNGNTVSLISNYLDTATLSIFGDENEIDASQSLGNSLQVSLTGGFDGKLGLEGNHFLISQSGSFDSTGPAGSSLTLTVVGSGQNGTSSGNNGNGLFSGVASEIAALDNRLAPGTLTQSGSNNVATLNIGFEGLSANNNLVSVLQVGSGHEFFGDVSGVNNELVVFQENAPSSLYITQAGSFNNIGVYQ